MIVNEKQLLGRVGEDAVTKRYAEMGFGVVARNLHISHNEIDLILQNSTHLVFVEVKTRHAVPGVRTKYGRPAAAVNKTKRTHIIEAAKTYLREHPTELQPRIDIAEVYVTRGADGANHVTSVLLFPNAFGAHR